MRRRFAGALLLVGAGVGLAAGGPPGGAAVGTATKLPIDGGLVGAWWRDHAPGAIAEAVHYDADGRYVLVRQDGPTEHGLWTTLVRGQLRWLRRCPARQGGVSPDDCSYFGRYLLGHGEPGDGPPDELVEEVACPGSWEGALRGEVAYDQARERCQARTYRFADGADAAGLRAALLENASAAPTPLQKPKAPVPDAFAGGGGGDVRGVWVGTVGSGPEQVRLVFSAMEDTTFYYTLEAGGQEETSSGTYDVDGAELILKHPDGEIEHIPFAVQGDVLQWKDEDIGTLTLQRQG